MSKVRATVTLLITVCILYFIIGGILALIGWFPADKYAITGGVVGGLASVLGLISLARPGLSQHDLDNIESDSLRKLAETTDKIKELDAARTATKEELDTLELQKQEMELLVQKASLSLFLREHRRLYEKWIQEEIQQNRELQRQLHELVAIDQKLDALNEEIESDPNVDLVKEIIISAKKSPDEIDESFADFGLLTGSIMRALAVLARDLPRAMARLFR